MEFEEDRTNRLSQSEYCLRQPSDHSAQTFDGLIMKRYFYLLMISILVIFGCSQYQPINNQDIMTLNDKINSILPQGWSSSINHENIYIKKNAPIHAWEFIAKMPPPDEGIQNNYFYFQICSEPDNKGYEVDYPILIYQDYKWKLDLGIWNFQDINHLKECKNIFNKIYNLFKTNKNANDVFNNNCNIEPTD